MKRVFVFLMVFSCVLNGFNLSVAHADDATALTPPVADAPPQPVAPPPHPVVMTAQPVAPTPPAVQPVVVVQPARTTKSKSKGPFHHLWGFMKSLVDVE